jgi:hypothetical protein
MDITSAQGSAVRKISMPQRTFRLVVQQIGNRLHGSFRVIAYGDAGIKGQADFTSFSVLLDTLHSAVPDVVLNLRAEGSIIFAAEMQLSDSQLKALGMA